MNKICKEYIKEIKTMFPFKSKKERQYIKNLSIDIDNYCVEEKVTEKETLYDNYGNPIDVVAEYFNASGIEYVIKKSKISKYIKSLVAIIAALAIIAVSVYCVVWYNEYQIALRQEVVIVDEIIE